MHMKLKKNNLSRLWSQAIHWVSTHKKLFIILIIAGLLTVFVFIPAGTYIYFARDLGSKERIMSRNDQGLILLDREDKPFFSFYQAKQKDPVELSSISENIQNAVIASEDQEFYEHGGFSLRGILRSLTTNLQSGSIQQGGSTLTQQLVKNVLLSPERSYIRKLQEVVLAIEIERRFTKEEVLEMYLNSIYFGEGAFGVQEAAEVYFGKSAAELTVAESALLAAILPAPSALSPISGNRTRAFERQKVVLRLMKEQGYITQSEYETALKEKITFQEQQESRNQLAPHFALMVRDQLIEQYGESTISRSGFHVKTTLNSDWQKYAETTVENQVKTLRANKATNAALVAIDPKSGEVLALVGSHNWSDENNGKINMAVRARQPGSSFKPLVYALALEEREITAGTVIEDKEKDFGGYKPKNYDNSFRGNVTIRRALANSLNIPAVEVMQMVGVNKMVNKSTDLGITTLSTKQDYGLSLVLGSGEVPLIEMTSAYSAFANMGERFEPILVLEVRDKNKKVIFTNEAESDRVWTPEVSYIISSILSDAKARAEVFGGALTINRQAAVKTGTTDDYRDALTIGYTQDIVVGVWVGNNNNTAMDTVAGSLGAAPIWRSTMNYFLANSRTPWYSMPSGLTTKLICIEKGLLLDDKLKDSTSSAVTEFYILGTDPKDICFEVTPTPQEKSEEEKKKEEEERKKREEEERNKNNNNGNNNSNPTSTPRPTNTPRVEVTTAPIETVAPILSPSIAPSNTPGPSGVAPTAGT